MKATFCVYTLFVLFVTVYSKPFDYKNIISLKQFVDTYQPLYVNNRFLFTRNELWKFKLDVDNCWTFIFSEKQDMYNRILPDCLDNPRSNTEFRDLTYLYFITGEQPRKDVAVVFSMSELLQTAEKLSGFNALGEYLIVISQLEKKYIV